MNYSLIKAPPENAAAFEKVPGTDCREQFIKSLCGLLRQKVAHIYTDPVPIEWVFAVGKAEDLTPYSVSMQRTPVNLGELGTAHGIFYLQRQSK